MQVVATMIANAADTTATEKPVRRPSREGYRVAAIFIMQTVPLLVRLALPLFTGESRDMERILTVTVTERPASEKVREGLT